MFPYQSLDWLTITFGIYLGNAYDDTEAKCNSTIRETCRNFRLSMFPLSEPATSVTARKSQQKARTYEFATGSAHPDSSPAVGATFTFRPASSPLHDACSRSTRFRLGTNPSVRMGKRPAFVARLWTA